MVILAIDGRDIRGLSMKEVRHLSVGVVGSIVKVVLKPGINAPAFEERQLTRYAAGPHTVTTDGDRTLATPRGKLYSDRSDQSSGSTWLKRFFGGSGDTNTRTVGFDSKPGYANGALLDDHGRAWNQHNGQSAAKVLRTNTHMCTHNEAELM
jgi:hypothetical protein